MTIPVPTRRFSHIHIDLVGPLPPSEGYIHLLTIIDRTTRWPEAIPMVNTSAKRCARALISNWISRFGAPLDMFSDRGSQCTSPTWDQDTQDKRLSPSIQWNYRKISLNIEGSAKGPSARAQLGGRAALGFVRS